MPDSLKTDPLSMADVKTVWPEFDHVLGPMGPVDDEGRVYVTVCEKAVWPVDLQALWRGFVIRFAAAVAASSDGNVIVWRRLPTLERFKRGRGIRARFVVRRSNPEQIVSYTREEISELPDRTDWARVDALTDEDIEAAVRDDPDAAPLDIDWSKARIVHPVRKTAISLRVDDDVLAYFKEKGRGYQTRINAVLRSYMETHREPEGP